jgi:2-acylglycerol O-acyltransferase 2
METLETTQPPNVTKTSTSSASSSGTKQSSSSSSSSSRRPPPQYIFGVFPHGVNADYRVLVDGLLSDTVLPQTGSRVRTLAASILFYIPVVREISLWTGCVNASKPVAQRNLQQGLSLLILPGGQQEQLRTTYGQELVYIQRRKGFVKLAIQYGIPLVPVYVFGVNDYYSTSHFALSVRLWIVQYLGISWTMGCGFYKSPYCPFPVNTTMVFGEPIKVPHINHPTSEVVDQVHTQFVTALQQLFEHHKTDLGYGDRTLQVM